MLEIAGMILTFIVFIMLMAIALLDTDSKRKRQKPFGYRNDDR